MDDGSSPFRRCVPSVYLYFIGFLQALKITTLYLNLYLTILGLVLMSSKIQYGQESTNVSWSPIFYVLRIFLIIVSLSCPPCVLYAYLCFIGFVLPLLMDAPDPPPALAWIVGSFCCSFCSLQPLFASLKYEELWYSCKEISIGLRVSLFFMLFVNI